MKRRKLLKYLNRHNCTILREGSDHTVVTNRSNQNQSSVPRHQEIKPVIVRTICKQRESPPPAEK